MTAGLSLTPEEWEAVRLSLKVATVAMIASRGARVIWMSALAMRSRANCNAGCSPMSRLRPPRLLNSTCTSPPSSALTAGAEPL